MILSVFHIPKTGGNTLERIIRRKFWYKDIFLFKGGLARDFNTDNLKGVTAKCIIGGAFYGMEEYLKTDVKYLAFLRNPINRVVSEYLWLRQRETSLAYQSVKEVTLEEFVEQGLWRAWNCQVRFLKDRDNVPTTGAEEPLVKDLGSASRNIASDNTILGLTERYDESLVLMKRQLGWHIWDIFYRKKNVTKDRLDITPEIIELIKDKNDLDIQLYNSAKRGFESEVSLELLFQFEVRLFRILNKIFGGLVDGIDEYIWSSIVPLLVRVKGKIL